MLLFLAFIFPLGIYCLILGALNRRDRPLLVSGRWDFAGVLFAASGFLLFVGPAMLTALHERWRYYWLLGQAGNGEGLSGFAFYLWLAVWFLYYVVVVAGAAWMLDRRRRITAVYNVDLAVLEVALARVLERLGVSWRRAGNHFYLKPETVVADSSEASVLEVESFPALCHATLRWQAVDEPSRQAIELELDKVLAGMPAPYNPAAGWFLSLGASILLVTLMGIGVVIAVKLRLIRG